MANCVGVCGDTAGSLYVACYRYDRIVKIDILTGEKREREDRHGKYIYE
jgi:streptogramin lyase